MGMILNGCAHSGCKNLKLAVSQKEINRTGFWCFDINSEKLKVTLIIGPSS